MKGQALCSATSSPRSSPEKSNNETPSSTFSMPPLHMNFNVLIADDNDLCRNALVRLVERQTSKITICKDGKQAFEEYKKNEGLLQLLILDYQMPYMTGIEVINAVREYEKVKEISKGIQILCNNNV